MRTPHVLILIAVGAILSAAAGCERAGARSGPTTAPAATTTQPASTRPSGEKLLLLEEGPAQAPGEAEADNSRCHVCHLNYAMEDIALKHAVAGIGCAKCHGPSDAHIADESWASGGNGTAPDVMFKRENVNSFCMTCHPKDKIDDEQHQPTLAGTGDKKFCTDCHGKHRLAQRKCKWK